MTHKHAQSSNLTAPGEETGISPTTYNGTPWYTMVKIIQI